MNNELSTERLNPLSILSTQSGASLDLEPLIAAEQQAHRFHDEVQILPTIGCEVEVMFPTLHPEASQRLFGNPYQHGRMMSFKGLVARLEGEERLEYQRLDASLKPRYQATLEAGMPKGNDAYWEFANSPAFDWKTLEAELDFLMDDGLIPVGHEHAMHITLGGIEIGTGGPHMILGGLELMHVPPERIRRGAQGLGWSRRTWNGEANGLRPRSSDILALGATAAMEFRTLSTDSKESHGASLRSAQLLGSMLLARRQSRDGAPQPAIRELGDLWPEYCEDLRLLWERSGLPVGNTWGSAKSNSGVWNMWAGCLDQRDDTSSASAETVDAIEQKLHSAEAIITELTDTNS